MGGLKGMLGAEALSDGVVEVRHNDGVVEVLHGELHVVAARLG
jgi:hypothetical protein